MHYRQGDVLLKKIEKLPSNIQRKDNVLAEGEVTGHFHVLDENSETFADSNGNQFVQVMQDSKLTHQEHDTETISKGVYEVVLQREYSTLEGVKRVMD